MLSFSPSNKCIEFVNEALLCVCVWSAKQLVPCPSRRPGNKSCWAGGRSTVPLHCMAADCCQQQAAGHCGRGGTACALCLPPSPPRCTLLPPLPLCSDGLWDNVSEEELLAEVERDVLEGQSEAGIPQPRSAAMLCWVSDCAAVRFAVRRLRGAPRAQFCRRCWLVRLSLPHPPTRASPPGLPPPCHPQPRWPQACNPLSLRSAWPSWPLRTAWTSTS